MVSPVGMNGAYCRIIRTRSNVCGTVTVKLQSGHFAKVHAFSVVEECTLYGLEVHWTGS